MCANTSQGVCRSAWARRHLSPRLSRTAGVVVRARIAGPALSRRRLLQSIVARAFAWQDAAQAKHRWCEMEPSSAQRVTCTLSAPACPVPPPPPERFVMRASHSDVDVSSGSVEFEFPGTTPSSFAWTVVCPKFRHLVALLGVSAACASPCRGSGCKICLSSTAASSSEHVRTSAC